VVWIVPESYAKNKDPLYVVQVIYLEQFY